MANTPAYNIVTMGRGKKILKVEAVEGWSKALDTIAEHMQKCYENSFKVETKSTFEYPYYIKSRRGSYPTSFSAFRWGTCKEDSKYFFCYIKKIAA